MRRTAVNELPRRDGAPAGGHLVYSKTSYRSAATSTSRSKFGVQEYSGSEAGGPSEFKAAEIKELGYGV
ncbi:hypothetical protein [Lacticaseibacillus hulanensis]|uniref:hypothetical protein n=1 Tax=Lacticaseibacillus hulanensis TaxID=2493111 RepID=UPI000FDAE8D6|nr:hypothetical protein [Lacticaseibacillus hulanensis]